MKQGLLLCLSILFFTNMSIGQEKYGHLNLGNLLVQLPETKKADETLAALRDDLIQQREEKIKAFQAKVGNLSRQIEEGSLAPAKQLEVEKTLQEERQSIATFEQEIGETIQGKRMELMEPILEKAQQAIQAIAKANGYVMIFDTSNFNTILFAESTDDVTDLVKAELGL